MQRNYGYILIIIAAALWALIGPVARISLEHGMTPIEIAFWRALFAGIIFCFHAAFVRSLTIHSTADALAFLCFGAFSIGGFFAVYQASVKYGGAALASVLLYTAPAWVAFLARIFFKERLSRTKIIAIAFCLAGVVGISFSGSTDSGSLRLLGIIFGLCAGFLYSTHYIFTKKYLSRYTPMALYGCCMLCGALCLFPFLDFMPKEAKDWLPLLALSFFCTYGAYLAYSEGLRRLNPVRASVFATFEPVFATLVAWWWWGETFTLLGILGALCILAAVLIMIRDEAEG